MEIRDIFQKDINRSINGVIKVEQSDEEAVEQELSEYVVTRELQGHFAHFFESYVRALDVPTDKIGVWISGFFGSGKSHFLKMLSYVLANDTVAGKHVIDYFDGKMEDPLVYADMRRCAEVPTEVMLFNVDAKGGNWKSGDTAQTALLRTFERVFYEHLGFYGEDLKLAKLEQFVDSRGKTAEFRATFERINGGEWLESRSVYKFFEDDIVETLEEVLGMSETVARHWFDGEEDDVIPIDTFVSQVNGYCEAQAAERGGQFRLLFMADEMGQFIGEDTSLMLNLQTLVEGFGARCGGRVWVMVTSQEAIDEVALVVGDDFSKIQGRFNTRLSLSSSSVDEVIQRRVLEKTEVARLALADEYSKQSAVLKNLFTFSESRGDLVGFEGEDDFCDSYPFANYQFKLLPDVMTEVRKHGVKAKHMSTGERSMLSAFQESAQTVQSRPTTALVPFWRFFDTISKDLEHGIIQVVSRADEAAQAHRGLEPEDVSLLKLLYLIRYIGYLKSTVENITILMVDDMNADKIALRRQVSESLERLKRENYVARQGDTYNFLTDEEQDIAREIAETQVDGADVVDSIKTRLFSGIYTPTKLRSGVNDFPIDRYVDDSPYGASQGGMKLNVLTLAHDLSRPDKAGEAMMKSAGQAIVVLDDDKDYYDVLLGAAKVRRYAKGKNLSQLPPSTQEIIRAKQNQATFDEKEAVKLLEDAVVHARCYVDGREVQVRAANAKGKIDEVLKSLTGVIFSKADYITAPAQGDADIVRILRGAAESGFEGMGGANEKACAEIDGHLQVQDRTHLQTTMGDLQRKFQAAPYGWREIDVAASVARLVADQRTCVLRGGAPVAGDDPHMVDYLRKHADKVQVKRRVKMNEKLLKDARSLLADFTGARDIPDDEDGLVARVKKTLEDGIVECRSRVSEHYSGLRDYPYPFGQAIEEGLHTMVQVQQRQADAEALLKAFVGVEDELMDYAEAKEDIDAFFPNQQRIFDESVKLLASLAGEEGYLEDDADALQAIADVKAILQSPRPEIPRLSGLNARIGKAHEKAIAARRASFLDALEAELRGLTEYAESQHEHPDAAEEAFNQAKGKLEAMKGAAHGAQTAQQVDALRFQLEQKAAQVQRAIDDAVAAARRKAESEISVPRTGEDGSVVNRVYVKPIQPQAPRRAVKEVRRTEVCKRATLKNADDVDEYLAGLRRALLESLEGNDAISLC